MVVHELVVSLFATYASAEYLHGSRKRAVIAGVATLAANALAYLPALVFAVGIRIKLPLVATCYIAMLYVDTVILRRQFSWFEFLLALQEAFVRLLPLFPLFSIMFAFVFLEIGELCEHVLGMSDASISAWLNQPIYYGVLYGPFAYIYVRVRAVAKASTHLPSWTV